MLFGIKCYFTFHANACGSYSSSLQTETVTKIKDSTEHNWTQHIFGPKNIEWNPWLSALWCFFFVWLNDHQPNRKKAWLMTNNANNSANQEFGSSNEIKKIYASMRPVHWHERNWLKHGKQWNKLCNQIETRNKHITIDLCNSFWHGRKKRQLRR